MEEVPEKSVENKEEKAPAKWHGGVKMVLNCSAEQVWDITGDFCALDKWIASTEICELVEGEAQKPGCVRYGCGRSFPRADGGKSWAREKLLTFDNENRSMSYSMLENNFGLSGYVSTYKLKDLGDGGVLVDWSFEMDPVPGSTEQKTADYIAGVYGSVLKKLEARLNFQTSSEENHVPSS